MLENHENKPLLVKIPETGEHINIRPLINLLKRNGGGDNISDGLQEITSDIDSRIRFLNINFVPVDKGMGFNLKEIPDLFASFYTIRDMFNRISVLNKKEA